MTDPETIALRVTVIGGQRYADDRQHSAHVNVNKALQNSIHYPFGVVFHMQIELQIERVIKKHRRRPLESAILQNLLHRIDRYVLVETSALG